jgi:hypothetical protein
MNEITNKSINIVMYARCYATTTKQAAIPRTLLGNCASFTLTAMEEQRNRVFRRSVHRRSIGQVKNGVFWDLTPCGSCKNLRFGGS